MERSPFELVAGETFRWRATPQRPTVLCSVVRNERLVVTFDVLEGELAGQQVQRGCMEMLVYSGTWSATEEDA